MISQYYLLGNSTGDDVGNVSPQTDGLPIGYDRNSERSMIKLTNAEFPSVAPDIRFNLSSKAILTNVVNVGQISALGLLVDEKVREILKDFNIMRHAFYEATVTEGDTPHRYYWLHVVPEGHGGIDFERSSFATYGAAFLRMGKISDVECRSEEELIHHIDETPGFGLEKIVLTPKFMENQFDLFFFPRISIYPSIVVSDRLCQRLYDEGVTGIIMLEQDAVEF